MEDVKSQEQKKVEKSLEQLLVEIQTEFTEDKSVEFSMSSEERNSGSLFISFAEQAGESRVNRDVKEGVVQKVIKILENDQFEARVRSGGNWGVGIRIDPKFIDGKINWRRWPSNYRAFSEASQKLLDEVAETYVELSKIVDEGSSHDEYGRFNHFLRLAPLNKMEREKIEGEMNSAFI